MSGVTVQEQSHRLRICQARRRLLRSDFETLLMSGTSISLNTQGVSKYFFEKVSGIFVLDISKEKSILHSPECNNHLGKLV